MKTIYLAGGCFWGLEHYFKQVFGVVGTETGFANGNTEHPTYEEVYTDKTGFAETVKLTFDEEKANLEFMLNMFFRAIDPTLLNQQGEDVGTRYRTGIYYTDKADLPFIQRVFAEQQNQHERPIVVEVEPLRNFYAASEYHQDYLDKHADGYCHLPLELFREARIARP